MDRRKICFGNDEAILYIRKHHPNCTKKNENLGKMIWVWLEARRGEKTHPEGRDEPAMWGSEGEFIGELKLPKTATQFKFDRGLLIDLYDYLDELGQT